VVNPIKERLPWAGLAAGPGAWMVSTQANYVLVPWVCAHTRLVIPVLALVLALVALAGAWISWCSWSGHAIAQSEFEAAARPQPRPFLAAIGALMGVLFALVILTQGAAALVLSGCER